MTTASDVKLTQQDEELAAHGDLVAVVPCDATGTLRGVDTTNRLYTRGTYRQVDAQFDALLAVWTEINDNLIAIRDATGGTVTIDDTNLPLLVAALGSAVETVQDLADATEAALTGEEWHVVGDAGEPAFESSWDAFDFYGVFPPPRFYKDPAGLVHIEGLASGGTPDPTAATGVFTLPAGYRPEFVTPFAGAKSVDTSTGASGSADYGVTPAGLVVVSASEEDGALLSASFRPL